MVKVKSVTARQILGLIESQQYRCALSGRELTPESASIDHIVPLARDGSHDLANLWVLDHRVNTAKGTMSTEEFVAMCCEVADHSRVTT